MISAVVASHRNEQGCYLTVQSLRSRLAGTDHEIIVVVDGGTECKWEKLPNVRCLRVNNGSPQGTRNDGIFAASSKSVLVVEDHVIVSDPLRLISEHERLRSSITFPCRVSEGTELFDVYGSETDWDGNLWYKRLVYTKPSNDPYPVSQFGHSCFVVDRDFYLSNGGYTNLLSGWGGEEPFLNLKTWMLGGECWLVPGVWHAHFLTPGRHGPEIGGGFGNNFLKVAYVLGGEAQAGIVARKYGLNVYVTPEMAAERKRICGGPFGGDLQKLRAYFCAHKVMN